MIFVAGISIALFISALLLVKKGKSKSDIFLFLWMLLSAVHLAFFSLFNTGDIYNYPQLLGLQFPLPLLHGVLLYYYVSSVTNQFPKKRLIVFLHLIPILVTYIYLIPFILLSSEQKIAVFKNNGIDYETFQIILLFIVFLSGTTYVIWSSLLLNKHKKRIRNQFSAIEEINLRWLRFLTYGLGAVWLLVIIIPNDTLIFSGVSVFVILIGFFGVQQKNIFSGKKTIGKIAQKIDATEEKYAKSGLSNELAEEQYKNLNQLMEQKKFFKNSDLALSDLASELKIHPNYLSQIINEKEGKNFYDYVNAFRVKEFKKLITVPENKQFTLMALAYDCGFNSKSSFNRYFKKITGQTPSQYAKSTSE